MCVFVKINKSKRLKRGKNDKIILVLSMSSFKRLLKKTLMVCSLLLVSYTGKANKELDSLLALKHELVDDSTRAINLYRLGRVYTRTHPDSGLKYYNQSLDIAIDINSLETRARALIGIGLIVNNKGSYLSALKYYEEALAIFEEAHHDKGIAMAYNFIGYVHTTKKNYKTGLKYLHRSLALSKLTNDEMGISKASANIGGAFYSIGKYDSAVYYYDKGLEHSLKLGDAGGISDGYNNIGIIHGENNKLEMALSYFNKSFKIYEQNGSNAGMANTLNNIGVIEKLRGNYKVAISNYTRALSLREKIDNTDGIASSYFNIAQVYKMKNDFDMALSSYQLSMKYFNKLNDTVGRAAVNVDIAELYLGKAKGDQMSTLSKAKLLNKALEYCRSGVNGFKTSVQLQRLIDSYSIYSKIYEEQGEIEESLAALKEMILLKDSLSGQEKSELLAEMEVKYQLQDQEERLEKKTEELVQVKEEFSTQKDLLIIVFFGLLIISALFVRILKNNKELKDAHYNLVQKNKVIIDVERALSNEKKKVTNDEPEDQSKDLLNRIINYLEEEKPYLDKGFSSEMLADKVHSNRTYVSRVINNECGMSYNHFINQYRIKDAIKLLTSSEGEKNTIESVAFSVGFSSKSSFNPAFKRYTGLTPSMYLKHNNVAKDAVAFI